MTITTGLWPTRLANRQAEPFFSARPKDVSVEITGRCQLRCKHCFNDSGPDNPHELALATIEKLLDEMVDWGADHIRLSGGEPTIHRQFEAVVAACRERGITIAMNTNGIYSAKRLAYLRTAPIELFMVSIEGLREHNDAIRGAGTFDRALRSCGALVAAGQAVMIVCHVGRDNVGGVAALAALAADIGVDFKVSPIRPIGRARVELPGSLLTPPEYLALVREVERLRAAHPRIRIRTDFDILGSDGDCQPDPNKTSCKAGRAMVNINYDGRIYPCAFFTTAEGEFSAGNVYAERVGDVWQSSPVFTPFRVHTKSDTCSDCNHYQRQCAGGCPAISHFTDGTLDTLDPTCFAPLLDTPEASFT